MNILEMPFTREVYWPRIEPLGPVLAVLHDTGNRNNLGDGAAVAERNYANSHDGGPSANFYVDRDGDVVHALDGLVYVAWSQGDVTNPRTDLPGVQALLAWVQHDPRRNANDGVFISIEVVAFYPDYPWTAAQFESVAQLLARASKATGIPINRNTVLDHSDLNTVNRPNDPFPASEREATMAKLIARANASLNPVEVDMPGVVVTSVAAVGGGEGKVAGTGHWCKVLATGDMAGPWPDGARMPLLGGGKIPPLSGGAAGADRSSVFICAPVTGPDGKPWTGGLVAFLQSDMAGAAPLLAELQAQISQYKPKAEALDALVAATKRAGI